MEWWNDGVLWEGWLFRPSFQHSIIPIGFGVML